MQMKKLHDRFVVAGPATTHPDGEDSRQPGRLHFHKDAREAPAQRLPSSDIQATKNEERRGPPRSLWPGISSCLRTAFWPLEGKEVMKCKNWQGQNQEPERSSSGQSLDTSEQPVDGQPSSQTWVSNREVRTVQGALSCTLHWLRSSQFLPGEPKEEKL